MSTSTEQLQATVASLADDMRAMNEAEDYEAFTEWLNTDALDVTVEARMSLMVDVPRTFTNRKVEVLVTFGGPNVYVTADDNGWITVSGYWGSDEFVERVPAEWLADALQSYADAVLGLE